MDEEKLQVVKVIMEFNDGSQRELIAPNKMITLPMDIFDNDYIDRKIIVKYARGLYHDEVIAKGSVFEWIREYFKITDEELQ